MAMRRRARRRATSIVVAEKDELAVGKGRGAVQMRLVVAHQLDETARRQRRHCLVELDGQRQLVEIGSERLERVREALKQVGEEIERQLSTSTKSVYDISVHDIIT